MGGKEKYIAKLDSMFQRTPLLVRQRTLSSDSLPLQLCRTTWKTQREYVETEYLNAPGGLSGIDAGQMSAWYVFSMGFYPVCPGTPYYIIGSPWVSRMSIA